MNLIRKNYQVIGMCFLIIFCGFAVSEKHVFAQESVNGGVARREADAYLREENQIVELQNKRSGVSEEQKKDLYGKIKILNEEKTSVFVIKGEDTDDDMISTESSYPAKRIKVKQYEQKNGYYCGPATTKQTLQYINGKSPTQKVIAEALGTTKAGTDGTQIVVYLNQKQTRVNFMISTNTTKSGIKKRIYHDIAIMDAPPIARLKFTDANVWGYSTQGHFLNISGYSSGMNRVQVTDPNITRVDDNNKTGKYYISFKNLQQALKDHPNHHLYW